MAKPIIRFEYRSKSCQRFWEPSISGRSVVVRYGMIGGHGKLRTKGFSMAAQAHDGLRRRVRDKLAVGFKPDHETALEFFRPLAALEEPLAINSCHIGEHVSEQVIYDICDWMTACIRYGMTSKQFGGIMQRLIDDVDDELSDGLGMSGAASWVEADMSGLSALYAVAVEFQGQKFICFNGVPGVHIVALRGDPGARAIEVCVLDRKEWGAGWPTDVASGQPIVWMTRNTVRLWDGQSFAALT